MKPVCRRACVAPAVVSCTFAAGLVHQAAAWDSNGGNPTTAAHTHLTESAIDMVKAEFPEVQTFRHDYHNRDSFSKTWLFASYAEQNVLQNREGRTCKITKWVLGARANTSGAIGKK